MTTTAIIENKIAFIRRNITFVHAYRKYSRPEIEQNNEVRLIVERLLYFITQATIDLGEAVISYRNFPKPSSQADIFEILKENNVIYFELMKKLIAMTGFRNVIAHEYVKINYDRVYEVLHKDLEDIKEFIEIVSKLK